MRAMCLAALFLSACASAPKSAIPEAATSGLSYQEQVQSLSVTDKMKLIRGSSRLWEEKLAAESDSFLFDCYSLFSADPKFSAKASQDLYGDNFFKEAAAWGVRKKIFDNAYWVKTGDDVQGLTPSHDLGPIAAVMSYAKVNDTRDVTELGISKAVFAEAVTTCTSKAEEYRLAVREEYTVQEMIEADKS